MRMTFFRSDLPIQPDGENGTKSFFTGAAGVVSIESTPMGVVIRRQNTLPDLLIGAGWWGIIEKPATVQPAQLKRGK